MRSVLIAIAALSLAAACGDDDGGDPPAPDNDTVADASGADAGDPDAGDPDEGTPPDEGGDMGQPPDHCSIVAQDCGAGFKCTVDVKEGGIVESTCVADGTAGFMETCTRPNDAFGEDDCQAGFVCSFAGLPPSDPQALHCIPLCSAQTDCAADRLCRSIGASTELGVCDLKCDPFGDECPTGTKCGYTADAFTAGIVFVCDFDGEAGEDEECVWSRDCGEGLHCLEIGPDLFNCIQYCNADVVCSGDDKYCVPTDESLASLTPASLGHCTRADWACLSNPPATPSTATATVTIDVADFSVAILPAVGATVKACAKDDETCATPLDTQTAGDDGSVTMTVPLGESGFDGYFDVSKDGLLSMLLYTFPLITADGVTLFAPLTSDVQLQSLLGGTVYDNTRGLAWLRYKDCTGGRGGGVVLTTEATDEMSAIGYGAYTADKFDFDKPFSGWDSDGIAVNLVGGQATLTSTLTGGAALATLDVYLRPMTITFAELDPTRL